MKNTLVDMNGIYDQDLVMILNFIDKVLLKEHQKETIIETIRNECDINKCGIKHLIEYLEKGNKKIFTIRRKPNSKSKLWNHMTDYTLDINSALSLF